MHAWLQSRGATSSGTRRKYFYAMTSLVRCLLDVDLIAHEAAARAQPPNQAQPRRFMSRIALTCRAVPRSVISTRCERGDLNPYTFRCQILSLVRLPVSPLSPAPESTGPGTRWAGADPMPIASGKQNGHTSLKPMCPFTAVTVHRSRFTVHRPTLTPRPPAPTPPAAGRPGRGRTRGRSPGRPT